VRWSNAGPISSLRSAAPCCWCRVMLPAAGLTTSSPRELRSYKVTERKKSNHRDAPVCACARNQNTQMKHLAFDTVRINSQIVVLEMRHYLDSGMLPLIQSISTLPINSLCYLCGCFCGGCNHALPFVIRDSTSIRCSTWTASISGHHRGRVMNFVFLLKCTLSNVSIKVSGYPFMQTVLLGHVARRRRRE